MKIDIMCSDFKHPIYRALLSWKILYEPMHDVTIVDQSLACKGGDLLFMISCCEFVSTEVRKRYKKALVIHASDLPAGRGWSPLVWQVLEGKHEIVVTLFEAVDKVDAGPIWEKEVIRLEGHELVDEINQKLFDAECALMTTAVQYFGNIVPKEQPSSGATYYPKRTAEDSRIDPDRTFREQFDLLRICDPERYPAFVELRGHRYKILVEKMASGLEAGN